jgi:GntR family transcriptional repressor for pyruvate dehydrogenase complex
VSDADGSIVWRVSRESNGENGPGRAYEQLADTIRGSILSGELSQGHRIPSEARLAEDAGVSRSTVREALRLLEESGFLERASPKILVVRGAAERPAHRAMTHALRRRTVTFAALHEALMLLDPELARLAALRRDDEDLVTLNQILDAQRAHLGDFAEWCRLDEAFHVAIAEASANAPLVLARTALGDVLVPTVAQFVHDQAATEMATAFHERVLEQITASDAELAALIMRRHIEDFNNAWERSGLTHDQEVTALVGAATRFIEPT